MAETVNNFFSNAVKSLKIKGIKPEDTVNEGLGDSIIKIKQRIEINETFSFFQAV